MIETSCRDTKMCDPENLIHVTRRQASLQSRERNKKELGKRSGIKSRECQREYSIKTDLDDVCPKRRSVAQFDC